MGPARRNAPTLGVCRGPNGGRDADRDGVYRHRRQSGLVPLLRVRPRLPDLLERCDREVLRVHHRGSVLRSSEVAAQFRATVEDETAFRAWYDDALPRVYGYLFERTGRIRSVAEELTQETFVELVRSRGRFDGRSDPVTWAVAIARHKLADHFRRAAREERRQLTLIASSGSSPTTLDPWRASERREDVLTALASLPAMQRAAVTLRYMDDLPVSEIAHHLGRSETAVESLLARGRDSLRRSLSGTEDEVHDG
jgi:RNA polymerase sigma-70 factor (ECF subfamily)